MTETRHNEPHSIGVSEALSKRLEALLAERAHIRQEQQRLAARYREIDRELADCQAAGRVFNITVDIPRDDGEQRPVSSLNAWNAARTARAHSQGQSPADLQAPGAQGAAEASLSKTEMPRIRDIVLDRLREAGVGGSRATQIQNYVESTYSTRIHPKTVGITLFRLSKEGMVRRDGRTWYLVQHV
jgi:hypothetical protein